VREAPLLAVDWVVADFKSNMRLPTGAGGTLFLFHRKQVRFFRKDGHNWRKKPDGKTVRETHEKLKVDNQDILNCYYAHAEEPDGEFQLQVCALCFSCFRSDPFLCSVGRKIEIRW
jgi:hypothetical protein